jgi:hypothetical protein
MDALTRVRDPGSFHLLILYLYLTVFDLTQDVPAHVHWDGNGGSGKRPPGQR